ncbi:MAG: TlpA disulfide reductase family protein [Saprospiraceae bacterium]
MAKYTYLAFLLLFVSSLFFSCKEQHKIYRQATTIIEGQITSANSNIISLYGDVDIKSPMNQDGKFRISTELNKAGIYSLLVETQPIYVFIVPGDKISITGDIRTIATEAKFDGDHVNENNYLVRFESLKLETQPENLDSFFTQQEDDFIATVESRTTKLNTDQQEYQKKNGLFDGVFADMLVHEIVYDEAVVKMNYPSYFKYLNPEKSFKLSDTYDSFLQNIDTDSESNLMIPSYKKFLLMYLEFKIQNSSISGANPAYIKKFNFVQKSFQNKKVKEILFYEVMKQSINESINDAELLISDYNKLQTNEVYLAEINDMINKWSILLKGKKAPHFSYKALNGKTVRIEDLLGKVVYIDVWATWCVPCLRELPFLEKLQEDLKNNDMTFLSISIDNDQVAWRSMVKNKKMKGIHLIAENDWKSNIVADYLITDIPRFIIIGRDGNIINSNAPRPSSEKIRSELTEALGS